MNSPASLQLGWPLSDFVPQLLLFLVIVIVGLIVAKLISKALAMLLEKVGFDRVVERGGMKKALASSSLDASDIITKILYYTLVLFVYSSHSEYSAPTRPVICSPGSSLSCRRSSWQSSSSSSPRPLPRA